MSLGLCSFWGLQGACVSLPFPASRDSAKNSLTHWPPSSIFKTSSVRPILSDFAISLVLSLRHPLLIKRTLLIARSPLRYCRIISPSQRHLTNKLHFICSLHSPLVHLPVLVSLGCYNKGPQTGWLKTTTLSHSSGAQKSKVRMLLGLCSLWNC